MKPLSPVLLATVLTLVPIVSVKASDNNRPAPNCALTTLDNSQPVTLQQFKGQVVYVDFWASWCGPCAQSFPHMNEMHKDLKDRGLQVLAVNLDDKPEDAQVFLNKTATHFLIAADNKGRCAQDFGVQGMPSSYLLDRNGVIRLVQQGFRPEEAKDFRKQVEQLLDEPRL